MNNEEIQDLMQQLQDKGLSPEDIADGILWPMFRDGKISREDLANLCAAIGLELDPDFEKDENPDPIDSKENEGGEGTVTKEEAEELKEIKPGETKEEYEGKLEAAKESPAPGQQQEDAPKSEDGEGGDEEEDEEEDEGEWEDVKKNLFKL